MEHLTPEANSVLRRSLVRVTVGGSLAMVYMACVGSPATTEFFRFLGATETHFGLFSGLPMLMLSLQFVGAVLTNRLRARKPAFMFCMIASRLTYVLMVLAALWAPPSSRRAVLLLSIGLVGLNAALLNIGSPLWFSWMADLIPHRVLNRYWGVRQRWMHVVWTVTHLAVAAFVYGLDWPIVHVFAVLAVIGVAAGIVDILLFRRVGEPPNLVLRNTPFFRSLAEPFRHRDFRSFLLYSCSWSAAVSFAASFMLLHLLKGIGLPVWQATLLWCILGAGNAISAGFWGIMADRHGHKPILWICTCFKPVVVLAFFLITPENVMWIMCPVWLFDGVWNAGIAVATNGYMMKTSPRENRSMFLAAGMGLTGICGGAGAILGGYFLEWTSAFSVVALGRSWTHYHLLFGLGIFLRLLCFPLLRRVREPGSRQSSQVLMDAAGMLPSRFLLPPVGPRR